MKIIRYDNPDLTTTTTTASEAITYNDSSFEVADASSLSANDFILLEEQGNEKCEIVKIASILSNTLTLDSATTLPHDSGITVTKLNYDQYKIYRSKSLNVTFTELTTGDLDYANSLNSIEYTDDSENASDNYYYKIYYYNSETTTETLQDTLYQENKDGYISIDKYREESSFTVTEVSDSEIAKAIRAGIEWIQDNAYNTVTFKTREQNTLFEFDLGNMVFADGNGDNVIDKYDFLVYEYDDTTDMRTYLNHKIIKVFKDSSKLLFSENVPSSSTELVVQIPTTFKSLDNIKYTLSTINRLIATNWILTNVDTSKIKGGITSWSAGGTNVSRDLNSLKDSIGHNYKEATRLLSQLLKLYTKKTKLRTVNSSLYSRGRRGNFTFVTEGGNIYNK